MCDADGLVLHNMEGTHAFRIVGRQGPDGRWQRVVIDLGLVDADGGVLAKSEPPRRPEGRPRRAGLTEGGATDDTRPPAAQAVPGTSPAQRGEPEANDAEAD